MIVVSDTTPLNYLVLIGAIEILPKLFPEIYTSPAVVNELRDPGAAAIVRTWAASPPDWLKIREANSILPSTSRLDPGEAEAISLAKEIHAGAVLLDELEGREVAIREGLTVIRTLAIIELAAAKNLIALREMLERLSNTSFRIDQTLIDAALARDTARRKTT